MAAQRIASQDELLELVCTHTGTITVELTAEAAGWLLALNTGNRHLSESRAQRFADVIRDGRWLNNGQPIIVSREGVLNDGQHRLRGAELAGASIEIDIRFGVAREAFLVTDTGQARNNADFCAIDNVPHPRLCAAMAKSVFHYERGTFTRNHNTPIDARDIRDILARFPHIPPIAAEIWGYKFLPARTSWFGTVLVLAAHVENLDRAFAFGRAVNKGDDPEVNGARRLRERMISEMGSAAKLRMVDRTILAIKAWNAWVVGAPVTVLKVTDNDRTGAGFPRIKGSSIKRPVAA